MEKLQFTTTKPESYIGQKPVIAKIGFPSKSMISLSFVDGRILSAPLSRFPSIGNLSAEQKKQYTIADDDTIIFDHCDEIYHIQDFFGLPDDYILKR
ncbi:DUF2442 domain-containing protein [Dyadobacter psychrotolerans]|uniref:DUF2442 domain-containing protein n=1 Tax=Dyadobacter psychrotolerans TaxID=2541721 RepID=A0A4R5E2H2_9BACT|nr:DUF2442 domain-containing protein [Dyadobacter psychrotolerans]TDE18313.1 hypothetical protein E0F88_01865 [Dyadobacter psychrotolerans]